MSASASGLAVQVEEFRALFERFERSAFRIEARDHYDVENERDEFAAFLEGEPLAARSGESDPWLSLSAAHRAAGRLIERVRIVSQPLTDYTRYEFTAYRENIAAGEKVRVVPRATLTAADQSWANEDFWIFDDELVVLVSYDDDGRLLGVQEAEDSRRFLDAKQRALSIAIDFKDFVTDLEP
jgi:Family of unknown function (DUF6879)